MELDIQAVALVHEHHITIERSPKEADVEATRNIVPIMVFKLALPHAKAIAVIGCFEKPGTDADRNTILQIRRLVRQRDVVPLGLFLRACRFGHNHVNGIDDGIANDFAFYCCICDGGCRDGGICKI